MKKLLLILLLISANTFGQKWRAIILNSNVYETRADLTLTKFAKKDGTLLLPPPIPPIVPPPAVAGIVGDVTIKPIAGSAIHYKIIGTDGDYSIIRLLTYLAFNGIGSNDIVFSANKPAIGLDATDFIYYKKTKDFTINQKTLLSERIIGVPLAYPFKLRTQDRGEGATITTDFTIGYTFGIRLKISNLPSREKFFTIIPYGFGLGKSDYFFKNTDDTYSEKKDGVAITYYTGGLLLTINKINIGLFTGRDAMIGHRKNWAYQGDWWFSFGLGYKFLND